MSKSIISNDRVCIVCGTTENLHRHHIFYGVNRKISEREGCWVYLCGYHHNMSNYGVHFNKKLDTDLKQMCQSTWEKDKSREDFIKTFGRSWL